MQLRKLVLLVVLLCVAGSAFAQAPKKAHKMTAKTASKKMPARDAKTGRFIKSAKTTSKTGKKLPARDAKTGRFIKSGGKKSGKSAKKMPARDPKTGRFIKSGGKK
jgi:hypothetical protein